MGGSFAFGSTVYSNSGSARTNYAEHDSGSWTGSFHSSTGSTLLRQITTGTFVFLIPAGNSKDVSGQQWGSGNTTVLNSQQQTFSLFQSGGVNLQGNYNLGSVVLSQTEQATSTVSSWTRSTQSSTSGTFSSIDNLWGYNLSQGLPGGVKIYTDQGGTVAFVQSSTRTATETNQASSSLSQRGSFSNGSYSFASVVYQNEQAGRDSSLQTGTQSYTQSSSSGQTVSNGTPILTSQNGYLSVSLKTSVRTGQETSSLNDVQTSSTSYYAAGSYSGGSNAYSLGSVNYQRHSSDLSTLVKKGGLTETGSQLTNQLNTALATGVISVWSNKQYRQTNSSTQTQVSQSNATLSEQGSFSNGDFALDSVVLRQSGSMTTTTHQDSTNSSTLLTIKYSTYVLPSPLNADYLSNSTTTLHQNESDTSNDTSTSSSSLTEGASYGPGGFALSSMSYDQWRDHDTTSAQTILSTETGTQLGLYSATNNSCLALTSVTATDDVYTSLSSSSGSHLHESGSQGTAGFSLGCVSYNADGLSSYVRDEERDVLSRQTTILETTKPPSLNTPNLLLLFTLPGLGAYLAGSHGTQSLVTISDLNSHNTTTQSSTGLYSWTARESGTYGNGSYALTSMVLEQTADGYQRSESASLLTTMTQTPNAAGTRKGQEIATETQISTISVQLSIYQAGKYGPTGYDLSSYQLNASSDSDSSDDLEQNGTETISGSITDASGTMPSSYSGVSSNSLSQHSLQTQWADLQEKGKTSNGTLQLGLVSMTLDGEYSTNSRRSSGSVYTQGLDCTTVTGQAAGSYHLEADGSYSLGSLSLSAYRYNGQSTGAVTMTQRGWASGANYSHSDNWHEDTTLKVSGSYDPTLASGSQWNLTSFLYTNRQVENAKDSVKNSWASTTVTSVQTLSGVSPTGVLEAVSSGSYSINGRNSGYDNPVTTTMPLPVPNLPVLKPTVGLSELLTSGARSGWAAGVPAGNLLGLTLPTTLNALAGAGTGQLSQPPLLSLQAPPLLQGVTPDPYGGWLNAQSGPNLTTGPWNDLSQTGQQLWTAVNGAYQDALTKFQNVGVNQSPVSMYATQVWTAQTSQLPAGVEISTDFWAKLGEVIDVVAGALNRLTGGLLNRYLDYFGFDFLVDPSSTAYKVGGLIGQAIEIVLMVSPGALGIVGEVLTHLAMAGGVLSAAETAAHGDWMGAALLTLGTISTALRGVTPCVAGWAGISAGVGGTVQSLASAYNNFTQPGGDPLAGILDLVQAAVTFKVQVASSCFTGRMLSLTPEGKRRIDSIRVGDWIFSRDEDDPYGPLVPKRVLDRFVRVAPIWAVKIPGQTIETTAEHPFWVYGRGWIPTRMLEVGDLFITDEGLLVPLEGVEDTGRVETVYNFLVEDFHTYFVSETEEGVSVWRIIPVYLAMIRLAIPRRQGHGQSVTLRRRWITKTLFSPMGIGNLIVRHHLPKNRTTVASTMARLQPQRIERPLEQNLAKLWITTRRW